MQKHYGIIRASAKRAADAANKTLEALRNGEVEQEPAFTSEMIGRIKHEMDGFRLKGITWTAKTLTDRGANSQESKYGADFMGLFHANLPDYKVKKGFLAQAKRIEPGDSMSTQSRLEMQQQCARMLELSPCASYLFLYSRTGIKVVPARSVVHAQGSSNPHDLYSRSVASFFEDYFECFLGDESLNIAHVDALITADEEHRLLVEMRERKEVTRVLYLGLSSEQPTLGI